MTVLLLFLLLPSLTLQVANDATANRGERKMTRGNRQERPSPSTRGKGQEKPSPFSLFTAGGRESEGRCYHSNEFGIF